MAARLEVDPADVLDASAALLATYNTRIEGFHGLVEDDVTLSSMGLPIARVNQALSARFAPRRADARIDQVMGWFADIGVPFAWRLGPRDRPRDLFERLLVRGFTLDPEEMPGMARSLRDLPAIGLPPGGSVEVVRDGTTYREWLAVVTEGFGMPQQISDAIVRYEVLGFGDELDDRLILARLDGRPVATALGVVAGGGITIINVTTLEEARGRGLGRAVTLATMKLGLDMGASIAVLESTEMGFSVYQRLGFESFGRFRTLVWNPTAS